MNIEFAAVQTKVFQGLKDGGALLASLQREVSIEQVEDLLAQTEEALSYQNVRATAPLPVMGGRSLLLRRRKYRQCSRGHSQRPTRLTLRRSCPSSKPKLYAITAPRIQCTRHRA